MLYNSTLSLFPTYSIPRLFGNRGRKWTKLVKRVSHLPEDHPEHMAFTLMVRRIDGTQNNAHAIHPMDGCALCSSNILDRFGGSPRDLLAFYHQTLGEVRSYLTAVQTRISRAA